MSRGGQRPGAGRKKGVPNKKQAALRAAAEDLARTGGLDGTPLEILLTTMRLFHGRAVAMEAAMAAGDKSAAVRIEKSADGTVEKYTPTQLRMMACDLAARAAPYCHARLAQVEARVTGELSVYEKSLRELAGDVPSNAAKGVH